MWTSDKIEQFCKVYGFVPIMTKSEIKELPNILTADEQLLGLMQGGLSAIRGKEYNGLGLIIATSKRIIFLRKSIIGTITKEEFSLPMVTSAAYRKGLMTSSLVITAANNEAVIERCEKGAAEKFIKVVTDLIHNSHTTQSQQPSNSNQDDSMLKLEKLFELKQKGILTEEEFNQQKAKILSSN